MNRIDIDPDTATALLHFTQQIASLEEKKRLVLTAYMNAKGAKGAHTLTADCTALIQQGEPE